VPDGVPAVSPASARRTEQSEPDLTPATSLEERWLYRVGGASALMLGLGYLAIFPLYAQVGAPPTAADGEVWLTYLAGKTGTWWTILALSVVTDILFLPVGLALYLVLKRLHSGVMLVATALIGLFVALDLAVTWTHYASLLSLSASYSSATAGDQRSAYVAAASYASAMLTSRLLVVYAIVILSSAFLMIGTVMLKGVFSKPTAYLGMATGILGIVAIGGFGVAIILNAMCATLWILLVGYRLCRLAAVGLEREAPVGV
jgi:hypothetical protein